MVYLVYKYWKAGELVLNICGGTFATAKTFSQLPNHCRIVGSEKELTSFIICCRFLWRYAGSRF